MPASLLGVEGNWGTLISIFCVGGGELSSLPVVLLLEISEVPGLVMLLYLSALPKSQGI